MREVYTETLYQSGLVRIKKQKMIERNKNEIDFSNDSTTSEDCHQ